MTESAEEGARRHSQRRLVHSMNSGLSAFCTPNVLEPTAAKQDRLPEVTDTVAQPS